MNSPLKEYKNKKREVGGLLLIKLGKVKNKLACFLLRINYKTKNYCSISILVSYLRQALWCPNIFNFTLRFFFFSHSVRNWTKNQDISALVSNCKLLQWLTLSLLYTDYCNDYCNNTWALNILKWKMCYNHNKLNLLFKIAKPKFMSNFQLQ